MRKILAILSVYFASGCIPMTAQGIPTQLYGKWIVRRILPTATIMCWGDRDAKSVVGTQIEYSDKVFRWKNITVANPKAETRVVTARQFHDENSGMGSKSSQVTFQQLGIKAEQATQVNINHDPVEITKATTEIPGDQVLLKDPDTIVFSTCNVYFEASRIQTKK